MTNLFQLDILTLKGSLFSGEAYFAVFPAMHGPMGVYAGHAPMLVRVLSGLLRIYTEAFSELEPPRPSESIVLSGGVLEVLPSSVVVLADMAIRTGDMDEERVLEAQLAARKKEIVSVDDDFHAKLMAQEIALVQAQISALRHFRKR